jgi:signal transduction histidine kinase
MANTSAKRGAPPHCALLQNPLDDHVDYVLLGASVVCVMLISYQLTVTLVQPTWIEPVTDWLRTVVAWPQLVIVAWVAVRLVRTQQPDAATWCWLALGMLFSTMGVAIWAFANQYVYSQGLPYPSLPVLFFLLRDLCFLAALILISASGRWLPGVRTLIDGVLWMSAITALSWYFVLLPIALQTDEPPPSKIISMFQQVVDLVLIYLLIMALAQPRHTTRERLVMFLLSLAVVALFVGDTWAAVLLLHPPHIYRAGSAPGVFWLTCYLLIPLAGLVRLRLVPAASPLHRAIPGAPLGWRGVLDGMQFVSPSVAVVVAAGVIMVTATFTSGSTAGRIAPEAVGLVLLLLAALRPAVMYLEHEQLRRERDLTHARESALRLANERMEVFLGVIAHELRTPLTSLVGNVHLIARRRDALLRPDTSREDAIRTATALGTLVEYCEQSLQRMGRLVDDVLDETRIRRGRLALHLQPCDLAAVVGAAVAEQAALNPERAIRWIPEASAVPVPVPVPVLVMADASRIEQVVASYVSNALKFSRDDQAVEVRMQVHTAADRVAQVSVHDDGVGVPLAEQPHIWAQFYQAEGVEVQSSSHMGVGMGLYISKAIVEGHRGRVGIDSAVGQGTTIWFTLPLASSPPPASPAAAAGAGAGAGAGSPSPVPVPSEHNGICN